MTYTVTNITVRRVHKVGDYSSREIVLTANVDPGADVDVALNQVSLIAEHHAVVGPATMVPEQDTPAAPLARPATKRPRKTANAVVDLEVASSPEPSAAPTEAAGGEELPAETLAEDELPDTGVIETKARLPELPGEPVVSAGVTDKDLAQCAQHVSAMLRKSREDITPLTDLIGFYCETYGAKRNGLMAIPQEVRLQFIEEAKKLK